MPEDFDGSTFSPVLDGARLTSQLWHVRQLMSTGDWFALSTLAEGVNGTEAAVSARLRDLRKPRFGGHHVEKRRHPSLRGVWLYRLVLGKPSNKGRQRPRRLGPDDIAKCLEILDRTLFAMHDDLFMSRLRAWLRSNLSSADDLAPGMPIPIPAMKVDAKPLAPTMRLAPDGVRGMPMVTSRGSALVAPESFSFCERDTSSGLGSWCIRQMSDAGRKAGGGIDTASLCGRVKAHGGWDLEVELTDHHLSLNACAECVRRYRELVGA